ncbi:hypothetical protein R1sor_006186 [Riccia sorocarpa]|uniref:Replitron HUH endonuclease domain-containing protein n=1 Tax=Riccia sorocarpa TaxID=122646 RepID=A0ABD3HLN7_9MARC
MPILSTDSNAATTPTAKAQRATTTKQNPTTSAAACRQLRTPKTFQPKARKPRRVPEKMFDVSLTIGIPGTDIKDGNTEQDRLEEAGPQGGSICIKSLKYKGLHTIIGIIWYCLKDEGQEHFRFYSKNVSEEQKQEGKRMHAIYGASEYKNRLELTPANVLGHALQFRRYRAKNPVSITFIRCLREMLYSGQYMSGFRWLKSSKVSPLRAERIWRACTTPESVEVANVRNIFFGIDTPARYFKTQTAIKTEYDESDDAAEKEASDLPVDDDETEQEIPIVNLERTQESGADLDRVQEALLNAGFAVGHTPEQKIEFKTTLPEYIRLWR